MGIQSLGAWTHPSLNRTCSPYLSSVIGLRVTPHKWCLGKTEDWTGADTHRATMEKGARRRAWHPSALSQPHLRAHSCPFMGTRRARALTRVSALPPHCGPPQVPFLTSSTRTPGPTPSRTLGFSSGLTSSRKDALLPSPL